MGRIFDEVDRTATIERYLARYKEHGDSPKSLGWDKGKQDVRMSILTSSYDFKGKSVLDIGCGFGDLNKILQKKYNNDYKYVGIDLVPDFIQVARAKYTDKNFVVGDFLDFDFSEKFDYVIASGIFNHKLFDNKNYDFIEAVFRKAIHISNDGLAFDFLSDKVDFQLEHTFHSSPERIIGMAYSYSRNISLRNDYMPFEFSLFLFKNDAFELHDTLFKRYKQLNPSLDV